MGDREEMFALASNKIAELMKIEVSSKIYETEPWTSSANGNFLNQVLQVETSFFPEELLGSLKGIESDMGRVRRERWADRIIDIDILYYGDKIVELPTLRIPHPQIPNRRFALVPLVELFPDFINPLVNKTHSQLLEECPDTKKVWEYTPRP